MLRLVPLLVAACQAAARSPVVIVPGLASNQLNARLTPHPQRPDCTAEASDWFELWITVKQILKIKCWGDNMKLVYDGVQDRLTNNAGVETQVPGWGDTVGMEELDPAVPFHASKVWLDLVERLVARGYERNSTVRGAPYDFRFAPSSPLGAQYFQDLRRLVEETFAADGGRVVLVSHSMGGNEVLSFLHQQTQQWKDTYIEQWISVGGAFGGSTRMVHLQASGDTMYDYFPLGHLTVRDWQRTIETTYWLLPEPELFGDQVLVTTPSRNYTAQDYDAFFEALGNPQGSRMVQRVAPFRGVQQLRPPGVSVVCMYSTGVKTAERLVFKTDSFDETPELIYGDGDGMVNAKSLRICEQWQSQQTQASKVVSYSGLEHKDMISNEQVLEAMLREIGLGDEQVEIQV